MQSKVIHFPRGYFIKNKQQNLTPLMIDTLLAACEKQHQHIPFGPADTKGSFSALVNRGLIIRKENSFHQQPEFAWQVTREAISMLKMLGVKVDCGQFRKPESFDLKAFSRLRKP